MPAARETAEQIRFRFIAIAFRLVCPLNGENSGELWWREK